MIYQDQSVGDVPKDIRNVNQHPDLTKHALALQTQKLLNNFLHSAVHAAEFLDVLGMKKLQDVQAQFQNQHPKGPEEEGAFLRAFSVQKGSLKSR